MRPWLIAGIVLSAVATLLTWALLRPHLVITDGVPEATDPLTPLGVLLVNGVLVGLSWVVVAIVRSAVRASGTHGSGDDTAATRAPPLQGSREASQRTRS